MQKLHLPRVQPSLCLMPVAPRPCAGTHSILDKSLAYLIMLCPSLALPLACGPQGVGQYPRIAFDVRECLLPPVPLGLRSTATFFVINNGYDNLELKYRLPADEGHLPMEVEFPEGTLIGGPPCARDRGFLQLRVYNVTQRSCDTSGFAGVYTRCLLHRIVSTWPWF